MIAGADFWHACRVELFEFCPSPRADEAVVGVVQLVEKSNQIYHAGIYFALYFYIQVNEVKGSTSRDYNWIVTFTCGV